MKLQLAIDTLSLEEACNLLNQIAPYIDIVEVGTPLIIREGMNAIRTLKSNFPDKEILADLKIMDAGYYEAEIAFKEGADYITVLGATDIETIKECLKAALDYKKEAVVDMMCVTDVREKVAELESIGIHGIAVHTGVNQQAQGRTPLEDLKELQRYKKKAKIFVAGGLHAQNCKDYIVEKPDVLIIGSGICQADNPIEAAKKIAYLIRENADGS